MPDSTLFDPEPLIADLQRKLAEADRKLDDAQAQKAATTEVRSHSRVRRDFGQLAHVV
jgi:hypothetical protein